MPWLYLLLGIFRCVLLIVMSHSKLASREVHEALLYNVPKDTGEPDKKAPKDGYSLAA